jgi:hypothetical protein
MDLGSKMTGLCYHGLDPSTSRCSSYSRSRNNEKMHSCPRCRSKPLASNEFHTMPSISVDYHTARHDTARTPWRPDRRCTECRFPPFESTRCSSSGSSTELPY